MKQTINILSNNQSFPYLIEYIKNDITVDNSDTKLYWVNDKNDKNVIHLIHNTNFYRDTNDWYSVDKLTNKNNSYIPLSVNTSTIRVLIPFHSVAAYKKNIKYALNLNTWINGKKIDIGSFIFKPNEVYAVDNVIKKGNNEYYEYIDFDIIDAFDLTYSDEWIDFRHNACGEPLNTNNTGSSLYVSLFVVEEYDNRYIIKSECTGGYTNFDISNKTDYLSLKLCENLSPLGFRLNLSMNKTYDWLLTYLYETYGITTSHNNIKYNISIKNKDSIIIGPNIGYIEYPNHEFGKIEQIIQWDYIDNTNGFKLFFNNWDNFEEGWSIIASLTVYNNSHNEELFSIVSNELPITQELFSIYTNNGSEKIIDINDMNITKYNVVNKIHNEIVQLERPNESKSNIIQPVFFKVKESEVLTLHPSVTENICINLDEYKSKVSKFTLMISNCKFEQIGANNYGSLFKITANTLPLDVNNGTYYILDDNLELITSGKYNYAK